jgi:CBS-domain-containing membrane protein
VIVVAPETIRNDHRVSDISTDRPLSVESALSVREAAIAIRYHGVQYLPVVDAGRLVGIVAFREEPRRRRDPDLGSDRHAGDGAAGASGATTLTSSSEEDR